MGEAFSLFPWGHLRGRPVEQQCLGCPMQLFRSGTAQGCRSKRERGGDSGSHSVCQKPLFRKEGGPFSNLHDSKLGLAEALTVTHILFLRRQSKNSQFSSSLLASLRMLWAVLGGGEAYCVDFSQNLLGGGRLLPASSHLPHRCSTPTPCPVN